MKSSLSSEKIILGCSEVELWPILELIWYECA